MKVILITGKRDLEYESIKNLSDKNEIVVIDDEKELSSFKDFGDDNDKVLGVSPSIVDWKVPNELLDRINNLKGVCLPTTAFEWVDGKYLRDKNIPLTNTPKYSTESVAEYAISMMFNVMRKIPMIVKDDWKLDYDRHEGWEVKGKTMGVLGLGAIGTRIAELGKRLDMNVIYWSKNSRDDRFKYVELDELIKTSDVVFPCTAKNDETKNLLNKNKLDLMRKGAFIVSITGSDIFDFNYAQKLVKGGKLNGIALESEKYGNGEFSLDSLGGNIWVTPPIAWFTKEAYEKDMNIWAESILSVIDGKPVNVVN